MTISQLPAQPEPAPADAPATGAASPGATRTWLRNLARWLAAALLSAAFFAAALHLCTRNTTFPMHWHADEPGKANQILYDHRNFNHPLLLLRATEWLVEYRQTPAQPQAVVETGRLASALFVATTVFALAWTGFASAGLTGMLLAGAAAVLCPQLLIAGHYMKEDAALALGTAVALLGTAAFWRARAWYTALPAALLTGLGCALAVSGKYVGAATLPIALLPLLLRPGRSVTASILWPLLFAGAFVASVYVINDRAFADYAGFHRGLDRETNHGIEGHSGLTMDRPNPFPLWVWRQLAQPHIVALTLAYPLLLLIFIRKRTGWDWYLLAFTAFQFFIVAMGALYFARYSLVPIMLTYLMAALAAAWIVRALAPGPRARAALASLALAVFVAFQADPALTTVNAFGDDSRERLWAWADKNIQPRSRVTAEYYTGLRDFPYIPGHEDPLRFYVFNRHHLGEYDSLDALRRYNFDYAVVASTSYERFLLPYVYPRSGRDWEYDGRRQFYKDLFRDAQLVWRAKPTYPSLSFENPEIRVYRLKRTR